MKQFALIGASLLSVAALGGVWAQQRHITRLEARLAAPREDNPGGASADEVAALAARVARLEQRAAWGAGGGAPPPPPPMAGAPPPPPPGAGGPPPPELRQLREDVDALLTGEAASSEQGKARLRALIAETQQQQWGERQERRDERLLQQLAEAARLNDRQRDDLGKALEAERGQRRELMNKARATGEMADIRPALQALREQTDQKARQILSADQYSQYESTRAAGRGPRGGGEGRPPRPPAP